MIDLIQCYWVVDRDGQVHVANVPSAQAPVCVGAGVRAAPKPPVPLSETQAMTLQQAAVDSGLAPLTFLNSAEGIRLMQDLLDDDKTLH